jgi:putative transposase
MPRYLRSDVGTSFFFTVVTHGRRPVLCDAAVRAALRQAIINVRINRPFTLDALVLMPDHLHCIWTLPADDADFSTRWNGIKRSVSVFCGEQYRRADLMTLSRKRHRESTFWQRRYWEHRIRDEADFERHADYIHFNPVKHGLVARVVDWPYSTYHRYVTQGIYPQDWGGTGADDHGIPE